MKCLNCGKEMEEGTVTGHGQGAGHYYEFTAEKENHKTGWRKIFKETIPLSTSSEEEFPAWYCSDCKKILTWTDSKK